MTVGDGDPEVISFGDFDDDNDDDDDMLDLFSFGADDTTATSATNSSTGGNKKNKVDNSNTIDYSDVMKSVMPRPPSSDNNDQDDKSQASEDSFINLLEQQQKEVTVVDAAAAATYSTAGRNTKLATSNNPTQETDSDMQDILDWLDNDDDLQQQQHQFDNDEEELIFVEPPRQPSLAESLPKPETPPDPPKEYDTLEEAVKDTESSLFQIRRALEKESFVVPQDVRPWLWAKVICGKTLEETMTSSIADSFQQWEEHWKESNETADIMSAVSLHSQDGNKGKNDGAATTDPPLTAQKMVVLQQTQKREWLEKQSKALADRIAKVSANGDLSQQQHEQDLLALLLNHEGSNPMEHSAQEGANSSPLWKDPLLPPVACAILSGGVPKVAAAVMLSQIISKFMPIVSLSMKERARAAGILHQQFYLLCSYHLPLLVLHLDKYIPGWYKWPPKGQLPQSWLVSHLAGEAEDGAIINPQLLLCLWDLILTSSNNSLRFFLVMALLDRHAVRLLLLTGETLKEEFRRVVTFSAKVDTEDDDDFTVDTAGDISSDQANKCVRLWSDRALVLWEETPISVSGKLKRLEDEAVTDALVSRQKEQEEKLRLQQEAEIKAQQEALEAEREKKENDARLRLTRARLVAFYRQHNPGKETNIDKIMTTYEGRYDVLDSKLKQKYGVGFNPALKPKPSKGNNTLLTTMNSGFGFGKRKDDQESGSEPRKRESVVVEVAANEVLPAICWSKEANQIKVQKLKKSSKLENDASERLPLKFYLVDCRPETSAQEQGRIPTSVAFTPDVLMDKDKTKAKEEMFESLRGTVHICVMGEGYASLPKLYGHKMTKGLSEFIKEDEVRINNCALFFLSRGFPFVSILEGGFAAAHSYLCQDGPKEHLYARNVLTDYDPEVSIFAQFERATNSSSREKAQRSLQNMFDSGITALTKSTMRFETLSSEVHYSDGPSKPKGEQKNVVRRFFGGGTDDAIDDKGAQPETSSDNQSFQPSVPFRNPFARKSHTQVELNKSSHRESSSTSVQSDTPNLEKEATPVEAQQEAQKSKLESGVVKEDTGNATSTLKPGGFAGFGAALNNSIKSSGKSQNAINPFARFGNLTSNAGSKNKEGKGTGNHFAGFNQFRKNMMKSNESKSEPVISPHPSMIAHPPESSEHPSESSQNQSSQQEADAQAYQPSKEGPKNATSTAEITKV
ncbi:hypothetical protein IV203_000571 [Nitzschia inconspicua]|uniref:Rhodanese domain-containing protein n=1 Tax=Nitzschia inconspicua TaxID=303405 RepID=A0A9K3PQ33_9STRA|nr:hypothetical protein IV203_000571 [Nitzschia inconspicua]